MVDRRKEKRDADARIVQLRRTLHTYAVAAGGGAVALIVTRGPNDTIWAWVGLVVALALHAATIYLAAVVAEAPDDD